MGGGGGRLLPRLAAAAGAATACPASPAHAVLPCGSLLASTTLRLAALSQLFPIGLEVGVSLGAARGGGGGCRRQQQGGGKQRGCCSAHGRGAGCAQTVEMLQVAEQATRPCSRAQQACQTRLQQRTPLALQQFRTPQLTQAMSFFDWSDLDFAGGPGRTHRPLAARLRAPLAACSTAN